MLRAGAARLTDLLAKRSTRTVNAHRGILRRDSGPLRKIAKTSSFDVHDLERCPVLFFQRLDEASQTRAHFVPLVGKRLALHHWFSLESFGGSSCRCLRPVMVDDGIAEDAIEPRYDGFFDQLFAMAQALQVRGLNDIFCRST